MEEIGKVIKTDKNRATVLIDLPLSCDSCEFSKFCSIDKTGRVIVCINDKGAKTGDLVQIGIRERDFYTAIVLNFVLPLFSLLGGILVGKRIWLTDLAGFLAGMTFIVLYFSVFLLVDKKLLKGGHLLPEIVRIIDKKQ
jgi:positive regulator of sigma E activity